MQSLYLALTLSEVVESLQGFLLCSDIIYLCIMEDTQIIGTACNLSNPDHHDWKLEQPW